MTSLEFMLLNPAAGSYTGHVGFVQQGGHSKAMRTSYVEAATVLTVLPQNPTLGELSSPQRHPRFCAQGILSY